jgi:hypothetical protein
MILAESDGLIRDRHPILDARWANGFGPVMDYQTPGTKRFVRRVYVS